MKDSNARISIDTLKSDVSKLEEAVWELRMNKAIIGRLLLRVKTLEDTCSKLSTEFKARLVKGEIF